MVFVLGIDYIVLTYLIQENMSRNRKYTNHLKSKFSYKKSKSYFSPNYNIPPFHLSQYLIF